MISKNDVKIEKILESIDNIRISINNLDIDCASILRNIDLSLQDIKCDFGKIYNELCNIDKHLLIAALLIHSPKEPEKLLQEYSKIIDKFTEKQTENYSTQIPSKIRFC